VPNCPTGSSRAPNDRAAAGDGAGAAWRRVTSGRHVGRPGDDRFSAGGASIPRRRRGSPRASRGGSIPETPRRAPPREPPSRAHSEAAPGYAPALRAALDVGRRGPALALQPRPGPRPGLGPTMRAMRPAPRPRDRAKQAPASIRRAACRLCLPTQRAGSKAAPAWSPGVPRPDGESPQRSSRPPPGSVLVPRSSGARRPAVRVASRAGLAPRRPCPRRPGPRRP
jgi:hypothetical protein